MFVTETHIDRRRIIPLCMSLILHALLLLWACWRPAPMFVQPSSVRLGERGTSMTPIYFARRGNEDLVASDTPGSVRSTSIQYTKRSRRLSERQTMHTVVNQVAQGKASGHDVQAPRAGSPFGSLVEGSALGEEIKPALPVYGPQPEVATYELPNGFQGDIVVEVTIDEQGSVVQTSLLRGLGHGLDEKVLATLQNWRFHPATRDGVPIPSRQDVYFHFPRPA